MIKKVIKSLKKVFIPRSEFIKDKPKKVEKPKENYIGVAAPVTTPNDSWFSAPVKTEKVIAYEKHVAQKIEEQKIVEAVHPKKEMENIHQMMYERVTKYWGTWKEELPGGSENFQSGWNSGTGMGQFK
jgi:hypothetical protein